jgi:hypothetical protein
MDVAKFGNTAFVNANADALTFRDETGSAVHYRPESCRTPVRYGRRDSASTGCDPRSADTDPGRHRRPHRQAAYVWISNQIGNTGALAGFIQTDNTTATRSTNPTVSRRNRAGIQLRA